MSRESWVFLIGLVIILVPFLGIPRDWKDIFLVVCGLILMFVGFMLRRASFLRSIEDASGERRGEAFSESSRLAESDVEVEPLAISEDGQRV